MMMNQTERKCQVNRNTRETFEQPNKSFQQKVLLSVFLRIVFYTTYYNIVMTKREERKTTTTTTTTASTTTIIILNGAKPHTAKAWFCET
jgi:hypothetical protein